MTRPSGMETSKVPAIERYNRSSKGGRFVQHQGVGIPLVGLAVLEHGEDIVSQFS